MVAILFLILMLAVFGFGFTFKVLWWVAAVMLVLWLIGFMSHSSGSRWYRW